MFFIVTAGHLRAGVPIQDEISGMVNCRNGANTEPPLVLP
jgi:hypothetical protein